VHIISKRENVVFVSEEDWRAMQETLYLLSIPGMREPIEECSEAPSLVVWKVSLFKQI
jgi:PHD/YefM family antitoxin component YafN of YafNO toxin-antitoxin module